MKLSSISISGLVALLFCSNEAAAFVVPNRTFQSRMSLPIASTDTQPAVPDSTSDDLPIWKLAVAGAIATVVGDSIMHPIDCIKTLQQSDEGMGLNMVQAVAVLTSTSGLGGLYRGLSTYLISDGIGGAIKFGVYERLKRAATGVWDGNALMIAVYLCAALAFMASSVILVPGEFIKQQLQMGMYPNLQEVLTQVLATSGVFGCYAGYDAVLMRDIPYTMLELGLYDQLKSLYVKAKIPGIGGVPTLSSWEEVAVAGLTGSIAGFCTTPLDTIKTKLMVDTDLYSDGFWQCLTETIQDHGIESLFAGALARILWVGPFTAFYLPIYDLAKRSMISSDSKLK